MKYTIKKAVALLLMLVMTLSSVVVSVNAQAEGGALITGTKVKGTDWTVTPITSGIAENTSYTVTRKEESMFVTNTHTASIQVLAQTKVEGLELKDGKVYTVDFSYGYQKYGNGKYILFSGDSTHTSNSIGWATSEKQVFIKKNGIGTTVQSCTFSTVGVTPDSKTVDGLTVIDYRLILDVTNKTIKCYVLASGEFVEVLNYTEGFSFSGEDFYMTYHMKPTKGEAQGIFDVVIYEGDLQKETQVEVNCGDQTDIKTITGYSYTLPVQKKAGYVFAGWRINDEAKPTPAGTVVPTKGLKKLTAVFDKAMSKTYLQFGNSNTAAKTTDVRIVSLIDTVNYRSIGYKIAIKKAGSEIYRNDAFELKCVYTALSEKYGGAEITLNSLGYGTIEGYFTALTLKNVSTDNADITVELTPYQIDTEGNKTEGETVVIDLDAKWAEHSSAQ